MYARNAFGSADGFVGRRLRCVLSIRRHREDSRYQGHDQGDGMSTVVEMAKKNGKPRHRGKVRVPTITLAHGGGGKAMHDLIDDIFLEVFDNENQSPLEDQARLSLSDMMALGDRLAFTTDSYVVQPLDFPGGNIGKLAICGTVNDLAVGGAIPLYLSCSVIIEEGLPVETMSMVTRTMSGTSLEPGLEVVTGGTTA